MRVYIASKYSHSTKEEREQNVEASRQAFIQLLKEGFTPFSPICMTDGLEHVEGLRYEDFMRVDLEWLELCDCALFLEGWENSRGCNIEHDHCCKTMKPVFYDVPTLMRWAKLERKEARK